MRLTAALLAHHLGGHLHGPDVTVDGASFDSRTVQPGQLFVPVVAERDGHLFIHNALARGASAYLSSAGHAAGGTAIEVADTARAFMAVGAFARDHLPDRVIGVTGSVGKTTVKDLIFAACRGFLSTTANPKSFNNELGLPQTLCNAPDGTDVVIVEMGMRGLGEIARLCAVARPTIGVVTVIGEAHVGRLGGVAGVAQAKGELVEALPGTGTAVLNADQEVCLALRHRTSARVLSFGTNQGDVRATAIRLDDLARVTCVLESPWGSVEVRLNQSGRHMALNAAAAAAAALVARVPLAEIAEGLGQAELSPWRMDVRRRPDGVVVINDAYNANPTSMLAALQALGALPIPGRKVAVLGVMAELDEDGPARHRAMVVEASRLGIEVVAVGTADYGVLPVADPLQAIETLRGGDAVLFKGSRVAGLEQVAARFLAVQRS